jgi:hypothetical protein
MNEKSTEDGDMADGDGLREKRLSEQLDELEDPIDEAIEETLRKIRSGRIRDEEKEKVRIKRKRALGYLIRTKLKVVETRELETIDERLTELENKQAETNGEKARI